MDIFSAFSIIALAGLIHASFQLSVSMATSLSGHALGRKLAWRRTVTLLASFLLGALTMTLLLASLASLILGIIDLPHYIIWPILAILLAILGVIVWVIYYRRGDGVELWIPRSFARFLTKRTAKTSLAAEAFSLGLASVFSELFFIILPLVVAAGAIVSLPPVWQLAGLALYVVMASLSLIIVYILLGSGKNLSHIQKWREQNKRFLQFAAGTGMIILALYIYVVAISEIVIRSLAI